LAFLLSTAPWHYHLPALNAIAYGKKRWFIKPPSNLTLSIKPAAEWYHDEYENSPSNPAGVLECTQEAGDIMFVPMFWSHATLNLETSIGFAYEFEVLYL
jgi:ribosomal protein L16 Arg81 hydroxylase